jgi:N-acetylglucosaminyl-diphospho-decaprenol L-rhamnosyltransferase
VSTAPATALIIVTYNSRRYFARLRAALEAQTAPFDLYIVDNASAPEERPRAEDFPAGAQILQLEQNTGFAGGNNRAAALAQNEFIALLNPDAFPEPTWLEELLAAATRWPQAAAFGSTQINADVPERYDGLGDCYSAWGLPWRGGFGWARETTPLIEGEVFSPCAAAALYRTEAWRAMGGFDEKLFCFCEDVDLGFRLRLAGHACVQAPRAVVRHVGGGTSGRHSAFAVFHGTRNRLWVYVKNMPAPMLVLTAPLHVLMTLALVAAAPLRGVAGPTLRGLLAGLRGLGWALQQRRSARDAANALRLMPWSPWTAAKRTPIVRGATS